MFFCAYHGKGPGEFTATGEEEVIPAAGLAERIDVLKQTPGLSSTVVVSPDPGSLPEAAGLIGCCELAGHMGAGLCRLSRGRFSPYSIENLTVLCPNYVRKPAAKTIAERRSEGGSA